MRVVVNGTPYALDPGVNTVTRLLQHLALQGRPVVVEVNREIVNKTEYDTYPVQDGDTVEVVHFVGGG